MDEVENMMDGEDLSPAPAERLSLPRDNKPKGAETVPEGQNLVNMDFPELTEIKDIIKAVAVWTNKNVILDRNVTGKVQMIFPKKVTKEEAYQAFLSALNKLNLTTVETGKVIKIMKVRDAVRGNLKTYLGSAWAPRTDELITQIIPLKYIDARQIQNTLSRIVSSNSMIAYEPTNTLIVSDSGYKIRRILEILELIDVQTQQPKVLIVPIKYSDPASIAKKVNELLKPMAGARTQQRSSYNSFKILTDERSNSIIVFGPPRSIHDIRDLVKRFDTKVDDPESQATIHVRPLDYADAKKLAGTLSSLASGNKSGPGAIRRPPTQLNGGDGGAPTVASLGNDVKITAEESSNSLLITGSRGAYNSLNTLIRKLDTRQPQVFIKAEIFDLSDDNALKLGTSIFAGFGGEGNLAKGITGWEAGGMAPLVMAQAAQSAAPGTPPNVAAMQGMANAFKNDMTIGVLSGKSVNIPGLGKLSPGMLINMMKTDSNARVVSSPQVLTSNNQEATVTVGETLFFKSAQKDAQGVVEGKVEKEPVDLTLTIKPNISHSNYLTLNIQLDSNSVASLSEDGIPRLNKRKTKQIVTVKNGQTIVVSGLMKTTELEVYKKMPLLGDIPVIGWFFRNSHLQSSTSNLVIFITAYSIHGAADLAAIYEKQVNERDQLLKAIYGSRFDKSSFYKRLPKSADGRYVATAQDEAEEKTLEKYRKENFEAFGYGEDNKKTKAPVDNRKEEEFNVPGDLGAGSGGGGGGGGPLEPPQGASPPDDFDDGDTPSAPGGDD
jgi:general secretion pathway protein D